MRVWSAFVVALASLSGCQTTEPDERPRHARLGLEVHAAPAGSQTAQTLTAEAPAPALPAPLARRDVVTVEADGAPLEDVLDSIGRQAGWNLVLEPKARGTRIDLHLRDMNWRDALAFLARTHHLEVEMAGDRLLYVTQPPLVTMSF